MLDPIVTGVLDNADVEFVNDDDVVVDFEMPIVIGEEISVDDFSKYHLAF